MNANTPKHPEEQEIDLSMISQKINGFYQTFSDSVYNSIQFIIRHSIILIVLLAVGFGLGFFLDQSSKTYKQEVIVMPNFESSDYLYGKINLIDSKISEGDTLFLKKLGITEPSKIINIEIAPVIDVYQFINSSSDRNFELIRLMAESGDIKKIIEEHTTSKNYRYHTITVTTKSKKNSQETINQILKYVNDSEFYRKVQKEYIANVSSSIIANDLTISQINGFLNGLANEPQRPSSDKIVYYNENSQLNDVIETKQKLVQDQGNYRIQMLSLDKTVKDVNRSLNIENKKSTTGILKILLPLLLVIFYIFGHNFVRFYKKQSKKRTS